MMSGIKRLGLSVVVLGLAAIAAPNDAAAQRKLTFGYDQPKSTGDGFAGDLFEKRLGELSGGKLKIDQFPGAQLGQERSTTQSATENILWKTKLCSLPVAKICHFPRRVIGLGRSHTRRRLSARHVSLIAGVLSLPLAPTAILVRCRGATPCTSFSAV